jgi:hypothetical protein
VTPIEDACAGADLVTDGRIQNTFIFPPRGLVRGLFTTKATLVVYGRAVEDPCVLPEAPQDRG